MNSLINRLIELDEYGYKAQTGMIGHEAVAEVRSLCGSVTAHLTERGR